MDNNDPIIEKGATRELIYGERMVSINFNPDAYTSVDNINLKTMDNMAPHLEQDTNQPLTYGERMVGINFNPGLYTSVDQTKESFAELIDMLRLDLETREHSTMGREIHKVAEIKLLEAQMMMVKALTFKN